MKDVKRWLPGALISILLIAAILYFVDLRAMVDAMRSANYGMLAIAFAIGFLWLAVRAIVWRTLLRDRPTYSDVFWTIGEGYLLNNFLPFRLGELGRAFLLSRKSGMQFMEILPTIVIERVVDLGFSAAIFLAALPFVVGGEGSGSIGIVVGVVVVLGLVLLYVLARNNQWALDLFHKFSARWPSLQRFGGSFLESFFAGLSVLDGWLAVRPFPVLDGGQLGYCDLFVLSDHPGLLSAGAVGLGDVRVGRGSLRRRASRFAGRSWHLRERVRRSGCIAGRSRE